MIYFDHTVAHKDLEYAQYYYFYYLLCNATKSVTLKDAWRIMKHGKVLQSNSEADQMCR